MICENCGAKVKKGERYCPRCGMELLVSNKPLKRRYLKGDQRDDYDYKAPQRPSKNRYEKSQFDQEDSRHESSRYQDQRYKGHDQGYKYKPKGYSKYEDQGYRNPRYRSSRYSQHEEGYDDEPYYYEAETKKSGIWGTVILLLIIALLVGLVVGIVVFSTGMMPKIS